MSVYYAGVGGNDGNAGTSWGARKLTIQAAVNLATTAGDTVYVGPGTYRETVTMGTSGSAGNVISLIGDYTGANTSGTKGVVRITGSNDDLTGTRLQCIVISSKNYITITGFICDGAANENIGITTGTYITVDGCFVDANGVNNYVGIWVQGASNNITISRCYIKSGERGVGLDFRHSANVDNAANVVKNCIFSGAIETFACLNVQKVGGITVSNCSFSHGLYGVRITTAVTAGQTVTVNNCLFRSQNVALFAVANDGTLVENYNNITDVGAARTNVTAGANSVARMSLFDTRWFFEMVNGGRLVTPFDLASYSTLVEYNSGTGAPATDLRGASVVGTYREWGALEYDANYGISGKGVSINPIGGTIR